MAPGRITLASLGPQVCCAGGCRGWLGNLWAERVIGAGATAGGGEEVQEQDKAPCAGPMGSVISLE